MNERSYRLTVVACAASWLLVGVHAPIVHQITHHGHYPGWIALTATACVVAAAIATVVALWRATPGGLQPPLHP